MTGLYELKLIPHKLDIKCPNCSKQAIFEFATTVKIKQKKDIDFFKSSNLFDYQIFSNSRGHKWHAATFFSNLHGTSTDVISMLPDDYKANDWEQPKHYRCQCCNSWRGAFLCSYCNKRSKHNLQWPENAYFSIIYKNKALWAFNYESCLDLANYIESNDRKREKYKWGHFLLYIPTVFKTKKARSIVVKKLHRILSKSKGLPVLDKKDQL